MLLSLPFTEDGGGLALTDDGDGEAAAPDDLDDLVAFVGVSWFVAVGAD